MVCGEFTRIYGGRGGVTVYVLVRNESTCPGGVQAFRVQGLRYIWGPLPIARSMGGLGLRVRVGRLRSLVYHDGHLPILHDSGL